MLNRFAFEALSAQANDGPFVLGPKASLVGCLELPGEAILYGQLDGELRADRVYVSADAVVSGTLIASEVVVDGEVQDGFIFANRITLRRGCVVTGEIYHSELVLEEGNVFEGKSRRHANPQSLAPQAA